MHRATFNYSAKTVGCILLQFLSVHMSLEIFQQFRLRMMSTMHFRVFGGSCGPSRLLVSRGLHYIPRSTDKVLLSSRSTCIWDSSKWAIGLRRHFHAWFMSSFKSGFLTINTNLCCWTEVATWTIQFLHCLQITQTLLGTWTRNDGKNSFND